MATGRADQQSQELELRSRGIALGNNLEHGRLKLEGLPEVAARELPQIVSVLRVKRQIQSKRVTQLRQLTRRRAFTQHLLDGIAGHDVNHEKDERKHEPEGRQCEEKPFEEITHHLKWITYEFPRDAFESRAGCSTDSVESGDLVSSSAGRMR